MTEEQKQALIKVLREMDRAQTTTDEDGGREVAWYYYRGAVEDAMGLERGALDTYGDDPEAQQ